MPPSVAAAGQLPKTAALNPNAPDFAQGAGLYNTGAAAAAAAAGLRAAYLGGQRGAPAGMMNGPAAAAAAAAVQQQKIGANAFSAFGTNHQFASAGAGINNFQSILTNQGINAYLSQLGGGGGGAGGQAAPGGPTPVSPYPIDMVNSGLADLTLSGKTLSELTDILGPESPYPTSLTAGLQAAVAGSGESAAGSAEPKFSRPIGAERQRMSAAAPAGIGGLVPPMPANLAAAGGHRKVDPYTVWEFPPSYTDNMHCHVSSHTSNAGGGVTGTNVTNNVDPCAAFSGLIPTLSGQTLSSLDNLSKTGFEGLNNFNGGPVVGPGAVNAGGGPTGGGGGGGGVANTGLDPGSIGGHTPAALTPNKADYSDWGTGSTSGSAPGSGNKNQPGFIERGDPASVRRNINQNQMWPKNWEE